MNPVQIQLSVEEGIEFAKFQARQEGFKAGVQSALDHELRTKLSEIMDARKRQSSQQVTPDVAPVPAPPATDSTEPPKVSI